MSFKSANNFIVGVITVILALSWSSILATQDPNDSGSADTLIISLASYPDATTSQCQFCLNLYGVFDVDTLAGLGSGFSWSNANIRMDSARGPADIDSAFDYARFYYYKNNRDSTNVHREFMFGAARLSSTGLMPSSSRRLLARYYFTATSWSTTDSVVFDSLRFSDGSRLKAAKTNRLTYVPRFSQRLILYDVPPPTLVSPANGATLYTVSVTLNWDDVPGADKYRVQVDSDSTFGSPDRDVSNLTSSQWTVSPALSYGTWWYWRVCATDEGTGKTSGWSDKRKFKREDPGEKPQAEDLPTVFALHQNYPNPFNPVTLISFDLPTPSHACLKVYNALGQVVAELVDEEKPAGRYSVEWWGVDERGRAVASGMYFYRFTGGGHIESKKMVLLK